MTRAQFQAEREFPLSLEASDNIWFPPYATSLVDGSDITP